MRTTNPYKTTLSTYNYLGKRYLRSVAISTPKQLSKFMKLLPPGGVVLDVGCAGGRDSKIFFQKGFKVIGVDVSNAFIQEAKKHVPKVKFLKKDLRDIAFPNKMFDGIWANAVLLHLKKDELPRVFEKFYRLLKPEGVLHVRVKKGKGSRMVKEKVSENHTRFFSFFTKKEIVDLFKKAGFEIIYTEIAKDELGRKNTPWVVVWGKKYGN